MVEQRDHNALVAGSIPAVRTIEQFFSKDRRCMRSDSLHAAPIFVWYTVLAVRESVSVKPFSNAAEEGSSRNCKRLARAGLFVGCTARAAIMSEKPP